MFLLIRSSCFADLTLVSFGKIMDYCGYPLLQLLLILRLSCIGENVNITVVNGYLENGVFECNKRGTLQCHVNPNSVIVQWFVGNPIGSVSDTNCFESGCYPSSKFPGRYIYTFNKSSGISTLDIANVNFDDDQMIYKCSNGSSTNAFSLNASTVKVPPTPDTTILNVSESTINVTAKITTGCIYPVKDVDFIWYSRTVNGSGITEYTVSSPKSVLCVSTTLNCQRANESLESVLYINTASSKSTGEERLFYVNVTFSGTVLISTSVGKYIVASGNGTTPPITIPGSNGTHNNTSEIKPNSTTAPDHDNYLTSTHKIIIIACSVTGAFIVLILLAILLKKSKCRHRKRKQKQDIYSADTRTSVKLSIKH